MKNSVVTLILALAIAMPTVGAQDRADDIVGDWIAQQNGSYSNVAITRSDDGTYKAQVYWVSDDTDENGVKYLDTKNPDKSLRNVPIDQVVLFNGLTYNSDKDNWSGTKIYDPTRGIRANVTITLTDKNTLKLRGSVLGIGETVIWTRK